MMEDIDGDGLDDLVCSSQGYYGYASRAGADPKQIWKFTRISPNNGYHRFTHGLGVGDVNGDSLLDIMEKDGWWQNPGKPLGEGEHWTFHPFAFNSGGSQMFAVDLDGDGQNEVVTGIAAHGYGLVYYRAINSDATQFERVEIMTDDPHTSPLGVAISQLHAVEIADINRDGVPDIVTGKRWWAHANGDPGSSQPATLLWIETQRAGKRVNFVPHILDNSSGVGTQVSLGDVNSDGTVDIVSGNKRGAYLFLQRPPERSDDRTLPGSLVEKDTFVARPAMDSAAADGESGGLVPALNGRKMNVSFDEAELLDWEVRGPMAAKIVVDGVVDTGSQSPDKIGEMISRPFRLTGSKISFEVAGNNHLEARVEVIAEMTGQPIAASAGTTQEMERMTFDVEQWAGQMVRIRVVDHAKDGFVRFDNFRMYAHGNTP
ncbi:MAG: VCBS repeat-containing protein [Pirellulaceae bacterium]